MECIEKEENIKKVNSIYFEEKTEKILSELEKTQKEF